jgi:CheY-like chemotaxis protein
VSADARPETAARLLAAGAGHFLTKPLDLAELERRLDAAAAATAGAAVA